MDNDKLSSKRTGLNRRSLLHGIGTAALVGTYANPVNALDEGTSTFKQNWSMNLQNEDTTVQVVDIDGDDTDEIALSDKVSWGSSVFGIVKSGRWIWKDSIGGAVETGPIGDFDGDGINEVVFRGRSGLGWLRVYSDTSSYLWEGNYPGLPGATVTEDFDRDGLAEVVSSSGYRGYLYLYDETGETLWSVNYSNFVHHVQDLQSSPSGETPQVLMSSSRGLSILKQTGQNSLSEVWNHGPNSEAVGQFTDLDSDGSEEIFGVYPDTGDVFAVDPSDGSTLWRVDSGLSNAEATLLDRGGSTLDAAIWSGNTLVIVDGASRDVMSVTIDDTIEDVFKYGDDRFVVVTQYSVGILDLENGLVSQHQINKQVEDIGVGDFDGDGDLEVVIGFADELVSYDPLAGSQPSKNSPPTANFTYSPANPETSQAISFDASSSGDSDGQIHSFEWDLDGDGLFERNGKVIEHRFKYPSEHTVQLRVTDDGGDTATKTQDLDVSILRGPSKITLAERIDEISLTSLDDAKRANESITQIEQAVRNEALDIKTAEETVQRLEAAEDVTETVLENIGPGEDDVGESYNLAKKMAQPVVSVAFELAVNIYTLDTRTVKQSGNTFWSLGGAGEALKETAVDLLGDAVSRLLDWFFGAFGEGKREAKRAIMVESQSIVAELINNAEDSREQLDELLTEAKNRVYEIVADSLRTHCEQGISMSLPIVPVPNISINSSLNYLHSTLDTETVASGLPGDTNAALTARRNKINEIDSQTEFVTEQIDSVSEFEERTDLINATADLFDKGKVRLMDIFEVFVGLANTVVGSLTTAFSAGVGLQGLLELEIQHAIAMFLIVNGRDSL